MENGTLVGVIWMAGAMPLPVTLIVCGLPATLSATVMVAARLPEADGVNVNVMSALVPAVKVNGVVGAVIAKSAALLPPSEMLEMTKSAVPVFCIATVVAALVVPTN